MGELFLQLVCPVCHTVAWTRERGPLTTDEVNQDKTDSIVGLYQGLAWGDCKRFGEVFLEDQGSEVECLLYVLARFWVQSPAQRGGGH